MAHKRSVIVKQGKGKIANLHWKSDDSFLCGLGVTEAGLLVSDLNNFLKRNKNRWKRKEVD